VRATVEGNDARLVDLNQRFPAYISKLLQFLRRDLLDPSSFELRGTLERNVTLVAISEDTIDGRIAPGRSRKLPSVSAP
jgi:hypothetical protein